MTITVLGEMTDSLADISASLVFQLTLDCVDSFLRAKLGVIAEGVGCHTHKACNWDLVGDIVTLWKCYTFG